MGLRRNPDKSGRSAHAKNQTAPSAEHLPIAGVPWFTGRETESLEILAAWGDGSGDRPSVCVLGGPAGSGTTQVAIEQVRRLARRVREVLWVRCSAPGGVDIDISDLGAPGAPSTIEALLNGSGEPGLVVLDGVTDPGLVARLIPRRGSGWVLVTTNVDAVRSVGTVVSVAQFDRTATEAFLVRRGYRQLIPQTDALVEVSAGLPLVIDLVAASAANRRKRERGGVEGLFYEFAARATGTTPEQRIVEAVALAMGEAQTLHPVTVRLCAALATLGGDPLETADLGSLSFSSAREREQACAGMLASGLAYESAGRIAMSRRVGQAILSSPGIDVALAISDGAALLLGLAGREDRSARQLLSPAVSLASSARRVADPPAGAVFAAQRTMPLFDAWPAKLTIDLAQLAATGDDVPTAAIERLASARLAVGQHASARDAYRILAHRARQESGGDPDLVFRARRGEAIARVANGHAVEGAGTLQSMLVELEAERPSDDLETARTRCQLGVAELVAGRSELALEPLREGSGALARRCGTKHPETQEALRQLAGAYSALGRNSDAYLLLTNVAENLAAELGPGAESSLQARRMLGITSLRCGRVEAAIDHLEAAAPGLDVAVGPQSEDALEAWSGLGAAYHAAGRHREAEALLERVLASCRSDLGEAHRLSLDVAAELAAVHVSRGEPGRAAHVASEASRVAAQSYGSSVGITRRLRALHVLAVREGGDPEGAMRLSEEERLAIEYERAAQGHEAWIEPTVPAMAARVAPEVPCVSEVIPPTDPGDPPELVALHDAAAWLLNEGRFDEAVAGFETMLMQSRAVLDADHALVRSAEANLAAAHAGSGPAIGPIPARGLWSAMPGGRSASTTLLDPEAVARLRERVSHDNPFSRFQVGRRQ